MRSLPALFFMLVSCADHTPLDQPAPPPEPPVLAPVPAEQDLSRVALELYCQIHKQLAAELPDVSPEELEQTRSASAKEAFEAQGIPGDIAVFGELAVASAEEKGPIFAAAVVKHGLQEACAGFPLLDEQRAIIISCQAWNEVLAELPDGAEDARHEALGQKMKAGAAAEGIRNGGVIDAVAQTKAEDKAPLFTAAVERYGLQGVCAGFPLYQPAQPAEAPVGAEPTAAP